MSQNIVELSTSPSSRNFTNYLLKYKPSGSEEKVTPFVIGITGGTASGKTTVCETIMKQLKDKRVAVVTQDSFYKSLSDKEKEKALNSDYNFDHPDAFDYDLMVTSLRALKAGNATAVPIYDFKTHSRSKETIVVEGADVILFEGILVLYMKDLRELMDLKIFVDTDADVRLIRRIRRDIAERGRDLNGILMQYEKFVKPSFDDFIWPTKKFADIILPRGGDNFVAVDLLVKHIKWKLEQQQRLKDRQLHPLPDANNADHVISQDNNNNNPPFNSTSSELDLIHNHIME